MEESVLRSLDPMGRIVIPVEWRKKWGKKVVIVRLSDDELVVRTLRKKGKLTDLADAIEVSDVEDFGDTHQLGEPFMVRFLDSSLFLHAYLKPRRGLSQKEEQIKRAALKILERIDQGEEAITSAVHISEVVNIVEAKLGLSKALELLEDILATENLSVITVKRGDYEEALVIASRYRIGPNDAIATLLSSDANVTEIYSFDKHFDHGPFVKTLTKQQPCDET